MRKSIIAVLLSTGIALIGCGNTKTTNWKDKLSVVSLHGEDGNFNISNVVLVLNGENDAFRGGNITAKDNQLLDEIASFSYTFHASSKGEDIVLMSNKITSEDSIMPNTELGSISGDILNNAEIENVWIEIKTEKMDGQENDYQFDLTMEDVLSSDMK